MLGLSARDVAQQGDVEIRLPQVAIPLGDLVLQNQVIAERLPDDVRDDPVILVAVVAAMRENHVRRKRSLDRFEHLLDLAQGGGEVAIAELVDVDLARSSPGQELAGAVPGLALAGSSGTAEDDPMTVHVAPGREEGEDRPATADLDVVGVGAETKDTERARRQGERKHAVAASGWPWAFTGRRARRSGAPAPRPQRSAPGHRPHGRSEPRRSGRRC